MSMMARETRFLRRPGDDPGPLGTRARSGAKGCAVARVASQPRPWAAPGLILRLGVLLASNVLLLIRQRFGEEDRHDAHKEHVTGKREVKDGDERVGGLDDEAGRQGAECHAGKDAGMEVADGDAAARGRCAVGRVRVGDEHGTGEAARQTLKHGAENEPAVVDGFGELEADNGNDLCCDATGGGKGQHAPTTVAVRETAYARGGDGAEDTDDEVHGRHQRRDLFVNRRHLALRVLVAQRDGVQHERRITKELVVKVPATHKLEDTGDIVSLYISTVTSNLTHRLSFGTMVPPNARMDIDNGPSSQ